MQSVKHFLVDSGWNQADLALALGVHYSYASLILGGKRIPSVMLFQKIAAITRIPIERLIEEAGQKPPRRKKIKVEERAHARST